MKTEAKVDRILVTGEFTAKDARFLMLAASLGAMIIDGDVVNVARLRELLLHFGATTGYSRPEMTAIIAKMRELHAAADVVDPGGVLPNG